MVMYSLLWETVWQLVALSVVGLILPSSWSLTDDETLNQAPYTVIGTSTKLNESKHVNKGVKFS